MLVFQNMDMREVPDSFICCSVCGEYKDSDSFSDGGIQTRTNCKECYELTYDEMKKKKDTRLLFEKTNEYKDAYRKFQYYKLVKNNSTPKQEYINMLKSFVARMEKELPDNCLITHYSYDDYSGSNFDTPSITTPISLKDARYDVSCYRDTPSKIDENLVYVCI